MRIFKKIYLEVFAGLKISTNSQTVDTTILCAKADFGEKKYGQYCQCT